MALCCCHRCCRLFFFLFYYHHHHRYYYYCSQHIHNSTHDIQENTNINILNEREEIMWPDRSAEALTSKTCGGDASFLKTHNQTHPKARWVDQGTFWGKTVTEQIERESDIEVWRQDKLDCLGVWRLKGQFTPKSNTHIFPLTCGAFLSI